MIKKQKKQKNKSWFKKPWFRNSKPVSQIPIQYWIGWAQLNPFRGRPRLPRKY